MKLKGLGKRSYNVLFHTHTVSGIVISFALFVIFYAGAFALFRHDIAQWENPYLRQKVNPDFSYEKGIAAVDSLYNLDWYERVSVQLPGPSMPYFRVDGSITLPDSTNKRITAFVNTQTYEVLENINYATTASDTIYHLHYFDQIPTWGRIVSGFVSLFFLFAIVTGLLIHWQNLFTKFYAFVREGKWKLIWTNAHTVLGVIGLPFQVMYAVTGAFFGILGLLLAPSIFLVRDGETRFVNNVRFPDLKIELNRDAAEGNNLSFTEILDEMQNKYPDREIVYASIRNYKKEDAIITFRIQDHHQLATRGRITMQMKDGKVLDDYSINPYTKPYKNHIQEMIRRLHYGEFGGGLLRILYFILSMITCFMIITGVLIWRTARDNKRYTFRQRLFHHRVTKVYLAICLSMFPAFAVIYLAEKLMPIDLPDRVSIINQVFFIGWLLLTVSGWFWDSYSRQNKNYLVIGGILSLCIPLANIYVTGHTIWEVWESNPKIAYVDVTWFIMGMIALFVAFKLLKIVKKHDSPEPQKQRQYV